MRAQCQAFGYKKMLSLSPTVPELCCTALKALLICQFLPFLYPAYPRQIHFIPVVTEATKGRSLGVTYLSSGLYLIVYQLKSLDKLLILNKYFSGGLFFSLRSLNGVILPICQTEYVSHCFTHFLESLSASQQVRHLEAVMSLEPRSDKIMS